MSFYCALSGTVPTTPVAAKTTGHVYEKALILRHLAATNNICPVTSAPLTPDDLLPLVPADAADGAPRPVPATALSLPAALDHIRGEWEALVVEAAATRRAAAVVRGELAHALYQYDAASRVIGRLVGERDDARAALAELQAEVDRGVARATAAASAAAAAGGAARAAPARAGAPAATAAADLSGADADGEGDDGRRPSVGGPDPKKRKTITVASPSPDREQGGGGGDGGGGCGGGGDAGGDPRPAAADAGAPTAADATTAAASDPLSSLPAATLSAMETTAATLQARRKARVLSPDLASAATLRTFTAAAGVLALAARVTAAAASGGGGVSASGDGGGGVNGGGGGGGGGGSGRGLFAVGTADGRVAVVVGGDMPGREPVATVAMRSAVGGMAWHPGAGLLYAASATTGEVACWRVGDAGREGGDGDNGDGDDNSGGRLRNGAAADGAAAPTRTLTPAWSVGAAAGGDGDRDRRSGTDSGVCALAAHPAGGVLLAATPRRGLLFLSTDTGSPVAALPAATSAALCAGWHPDGLVAGAGHVDGAVRLWDIKSGAAAATLVEPGSDGGGGDPGVTGVAFSENGYYVVTAAAAGVRVWDLRKLGVARSAAGGGWGGGGVALDASGLYAAVVGGRGGGVTIAEVKKLKVLSTPAAGGGAGGAEGGRGVVLWGADARWLAVGGETADGGGVVTYYAPP